MQIYLVGGAVRDQLLGLSVHERDWVVVGATPQQMIVLGYRQVGKDFPVFLHPQTHEEYALARTERKVGKGYTQFACYAAPDVTLEADLKRRDLTINAMAQTLEAQIIDPYGGQNDLQNKILRHVSPAFTEDPVRILRVARFAARYAYLGFRIADETMTLMQQMVNAGEVEALVADRVWQEWDRALAEPDPHIFFEVLRQCGALAILFPEIEQLFGVPNPAQWHPEIDTGIHTLMVLQQAAKLTQNRPIRFAALLHDLGKGTTPPEHWPSHPGHEERGAELIEQLCKRYPVPRDYKTLAKLTARYHSHCHRAFELKATTLVKTLTHLDAFRRPERFQQFLTACEADSRGRTGFENHPYPQRDYFDKALQATMQVSAKPFVETGLTGNKLGLAIHRQRVSIIKEIIKAHVQSDKTM